VSYVWFEYCVVVCSVLLVWCVYCVVLYQRVIGMVCVECGGLAACYMYGVCTVWLCGSVL